jgi:hypothetical protein
MAGQLTFDWYNSSVVYKSVGMIDYDLTDAEFNAICAYLAG